MNLSEMPDGQLEQLFRNCVNAIRERKPNAAKAEALITEINAVWRTRQEAAAVGRYKAESPKIGVLSKIGYHVGNDAAPKAVRRALLDFVMTGELPFVGSPAHMLEWGAPNSAARYKKLHRVLTIHASSARTQGDHKRAAGAHWREDIAYIEQVWKPRVG